MTEKSEDQPIEIFLRVGRNYFRHATPLTGPGLGAGYFLPSLLQGFYRCKQPLALA
jgi:hypothetical protein